MARLADHPEGIRPLLARGRRVVVDGAPICSVCGRAVTPAGVDRWRHLPAGRAYPTRSRWLSSVPPDAVLTSATFGELTTRFPALARTTTDTEWLEGRRRLAKYAAALAAARRRRRWRAGENPYLELVRTLGAPAWRLSPGLAVVLDLPQRRRELAALFSWAIPTADALAVVARFAPVIEPGAGMAYWTALLRAARVDAVASDLHPPGAGSVNRYHPGGHNAWTPVARTASAPAVRAHPDRTLLLCWPPLDDDAASYSVLRAYRGDILLYVGEGADGATGTARFHRELALNWSIVEQVRLPTWPWTADRLVVYRRHPLRRPHTVRDRCFQCGRFLPTGSIGRCDPCFRRRPPALAIRQGRHRLEYTDEMVLAMPPALRLALERSRNRIT